MDKEQACEGAESKHTVNEDKIVDSSRQLIDAPQTNWDMSKE